MYGEPQYIGIHHGSRQDSLDEFRVSPTIKALLEIAAERENRSQINMLETLVFVHGEQYKLSVPPTKIGQGKGAKK